MRQAARDGCRDRGDRPAGGDHAQRFVGVLDPVVGQRCGSAALPVEGPEGAPLRMEPRAAGERLVEEVVDAQLVVPGEPVADGHEDQHLTGLQGERAESVLWRRLH
ncbi:MAG TPA: hypothetical protein VK631_11740, partial [Solirubrobacteraceae bacterium]|nr:hypothetical protein [Solirubrobacteraceae bacterium]